MSKYLAYIILATLLSSCKPVEFHFLNPEGPPDYQEGFDDGCQSGISSGGSILQRWIYTYKKNPQKLENSLYRMGWNEGWTYCRFTITAPDAF